jgi:hypothetical protein
MYNLKDNTTIEVSVNSTTAVAEKTNYYDAVDDKTNDSTPTSDFSKYKNTEFITKPKLASLAGYNSYCNYNDDCSSSSNSCCKEISYSSSDYTSYKYVCDSAYSSSCI